LPLILENQGISKIKALRESFEIEFSHSEFHASQTWREAQELALCARQPFLMKLFFLAPLINVLIM